MQPNSPFLRLERQNVGDASAPKPVLEIVFGTMTMIVIIFVHGAGIRTINQRFSEPWIHVNATTAYWRLNLLLAMTMAFLAALHLPRSGDCFAPEVHRHHYSDVAIGPCMDSSPLARVLFERVAVAGWCGHVSDL